MAKKTTKKNKQTLEQKLWAAAEKLRGNQESGQYKHVVLGLIFLKYISDRFSERRAELEESLSNPESDGYVPNEERRLKFLEDRDEYQKRNVFWVPVEARWQAIQNQAKSPEIGVIIDKAMDMIERENPSLKGVLPRDYARDGLDKERLGGLVDLIGSIGFGESDDHGSDDVLGSVYEYFLGQFAGKEEGKDAGAFYTPRNVVRLLVEMLEPYKGRVFDPACGSGGMFVQSAKFVESHGGNRNDISVYGQEYTDTTWKLAKMNLALRGIEADLGNKSANSFTEDLHRDLRADYILANPPFNQKEWWSPSLEGDARWKYGTPPEGKAGSNFAWIQHFIYHLSPRGEAGFVLANGSLTDNTGENSKTRQSLIEDELVDCIVSLPGKLFFNTPIPACLWFVSRNRFGNGHRARDGEVLFIDARKLGVPKSRKLSELTDEDIAKIADTYHAWRNYDGGYEDVPGFSKSATLEEIAKNNFVLTPGRYVGLEEAEVDDEPVEDKTQRLTKELMDEFERGQELEKRIRAALGESSYELG